MNTEGVIPHNIYFEGNVQSLGLATEKGRATVGVMKQGSYKFSASLPEEMVIIAGAVNVKLPDGEWTKYTAQGKFHVQAGTAFDIVCDTDAAYICYYV